MTNKKVIFTEKWTSSLQDSNQSKVYAELKKQHIYCSASLEDKLDSLFSKPVQQPLFFFFPKKN